MKMKRLLLLASAVALLLVFAFPGSAPGEDASPAPGPGKVTLSLRDYLALIEKVETLDRERAVRVQQQRREQRALPVAAERQHATVVTNLERPENRELHRPHASRSKAGRPRPAAAWRSAAASRCP